jgi:hypothetical protein
MNTESLTEAQKELLAETKVFMNNVGDMTLNEIKLLFNRTVKANRAVELAESATKHLSSLDITNGEMLAGLTTAVAAQLLELTLESAGYTEEVVKERWNEKTT